MTYNKTFWKAYEIVYNSSLIILEMILKLTK
jgi:hypothetical protein